MKTFVVGLTGSIGSGKSTLANALAEKSVPIIDADHIARELVAPGSDNLKAIEQHFGQSVIDEQGALNRRALRQRILSDPQARHWLESLLHPQIFEQIKSQINAQTASYCLVVIPLLAEHFERYAPLLHHVITVETTQEDQIRWATKRDNVDAKDVQAMLDLQVSPTERLVIADTVIENNGTLDDLQKKVEALHQKLTQQNAP